MGNIFFERFAELCKALGGTPNSVAKDLGISSGSITAWKNGTEPRYSTVAKIADYFDTTTDYLLGRTNDPENEDRFGLDISDELQPSTSSKKAPTVSGERKDILDEVDVAFYGDYKELDEDDKETLRAMARVMKERKAKRNQEK